MAERQHYLEIARTYDSLECACGASIRRPPGLANFFWEEMKRDFTKTHDPWFVDEVQFGRLLSEIASTWEITAQQWADLCDSMDLTEREILEIFERAHLSFQKSKERLDNR